LKAQTQHLNRSRRILAIAILAIGFGGISFTTECPAQQAQQVVQKQAPPAPSRTPESAVTLFRKGRDLIDDRKWADAAAVFNEFVRAYPRDRNRPAGLYWLAFCLKHQGQTKEADGVLVRLLKDHAKSSWADDARLMRLELSRTTAGSTGVPETRSTGPAKAPPAAVATSPKPPAPAIKPPVDVDGKPAATEWKPETIQRQAYKEKPIAPTKIRGPEINKKQIGGEPKMPPNGPKVAQKPPAKQGKQLDTREAEELIAIQNLFETDPDAATNRAVALLKGSQALRYASLSLIARQAGERAWPVLVGVAGDPSSDESLRLQAIYWISRQPGDRAPRALIQLYDSQPQPNDAIRERLVGALSVSDGNFARAKMIQIAGSDRNARIRETAIRRIGPPIDPDTVAALGRLYDDQHDDLLRERVIGLLARARTDASEAKLIDIARNEKNVRLRERAIGAIAQRDSSTAAAALIDVYDRETDPGLKRRTLECLAKTDGERAIEKLTKIAREDNDTDLRVLAIDRLSRRKGAESTAVFVGLYDAQKENRVKELILDWLGQRGGPEGVQKLIAIARDDSSSRLKQRALANLARSKDPEAIKFLEQIQKR